MVLLYSWLAPAIALTGAVSNVWASPVPEADGILAERQAGQFFPVTGVLEGGNALRREIRDLRANEPMQWNLFIQAMERFQAADESLKSSYYLMAGIHGVPFKSWDGVTGTGPYGYCPHSSNLFAPWHRPYMALIEQRMHFFAIQIALEFPAGTQQDQYRAAATALRFPYWDWAAKIIPAMPDALTKSTISVTRPNGSQVSIANPLFSYKFHPLIPADMGGQPFNYWDVTKRAPSSTAQTAKSNNPQVAAGFAQNAASYRSRVYNLMIGGGTFNTITSHGAGSQGDTIESVHDNIHAGFGSNSHMLYLSYSAFDPAFFLHHMNVDRLIAIWQKLHPNTYVENYQQSGATYTIAQGSTQGPTSPLTPFHSDQSGNFWTSNAVRDHTAFHYDYPELTGNPTVAQVRASVNSLYGSSAAGVSSALGTAIKKRSLEDATASDLDQLIARDDVLQQYYISVGAPLNAMEGPYTTSVFLGDYDESDPSSWPTDPNLVGYHTVLGNKAGANNLVYGHIIMTQTLLSKFSSGLLDSLDEATVISYIKDNLHWKVSTAAGEVIDEDTIPDLDVQLVSNIVEPRLSPTDFPTFIKTDLKHGFINSTMGGLGSLDGLPSPGKACSD